MEIKEFAEKAHKNAMEKGFWNKDRNFLEALMLIVSEAGECCDAYRKTDWETVKEELADIMIRTVDLAHGFDIDIESEIMKKMEYNKTRSHMHNRIC